MQSATAKKVQVFYCICLCGWICSFIWAEFRTSWNSVCIMVCTLIVHVSLRCLAFKIGTFVIRSSPSMTGSVNRVLLMMLYWFPNWITSQHSITTTQSVQQTARSKQMCFSRESKKSVMFFKWCTVSNSEPQGFTVDKYCCIGCWEIFLS